VFLSLGLFSNRNDCSLLPVAGPAAAGYTVPSMSSRGKLLAVEGIDGAGKGTQVELLAGALRARGLDPFKISFPRYQSFFGQSVTRYLTGEFGRLDQVDPHFSALLYAGDRFEAKSEIESALAAGRLVIADRYTGSNAAHQGARVPPERRREFLEWLRRLEYQVFGMPHEDLVLYLRVPVDEAVRRTARRAPRLDRDIQEADRQHLEGAAGVYEQLAAERGWVVAEGFDSVAGQLRPAEAIHKEILGLIESRLAAPSSPPAGVS
jgi:dTMP kinase